MTHEEMSPEEAAKRCIIDSGVQVAKMWGMSDAAGALRGALILADGPTSMDDLVKNIGRVFSKQMMGDFATVIKLSLNDYDDMNIKVGDRISIDINKVQMGRP